MYDLHHSMTIDETDRKGRKGKDIWVSTTVTKQIWDRNKTMKTS